MFIVAQFNEIHLYISPFLSGFIREASHMYTVMQSCLLKSVSQ